jgi:predicted transcriptional regulator/DNA-binding XRE family transcriptional regulator
MPRSALTGTRIRERRALSGMKQADLARAAGISPAYLNLIEHNRRRVSEALLTRLAAVLSVEVATLAEGAESALFEALREAASGAQASDAAPEINRTEEFVGRFPGWAALLAARQGRLAALERTVETMTERMAHDPHLSTSLHEVLSAVTSVRSTAAILAETADIEPEWQARFHANLHEDSVRLTEAAGALVAYLDTSQESETGLSSPQEEVEAWLAATGYHLAPLERAQPPAPERIITGVPELATASARTLALVHIARYRADAQAVPLEPLRAALESGEAEPAALAARLGVPIATVLRRMASLPPDAGGTATGLVMCDASGTLTFRKPAPGFTLPRFGAACPLWPLYEALARPMVPIRATVEVAGRVPQRFVTYAICETRHPMGFDGPAVAEAVMLILPARTARGDGERAVGTSCRICPRGDCPARREPSILVEGY